MLIFKFIDNRHHIIKEFLTAIIKWCIECYYIRLLYQHNRHLQAFSRLLVTRTDQMVIHFLRYSRLFTCHIRLFTAAHISEIFPHRKIRRQCRIFMHHNCTSVTGYVYLSAIRPAQSGNTLTQKRLA